MAKSIYIYIYRKTDTLWRCGFLTLGQEAGLSHLHPTDCTHGSWERQECDRPSLVLKHAVFPLKIFTIENWETEKPESERGSDTADSFLSRTNSVWTEYKPISCSDSVPPAPTEVLPSYITAQGMLGTLMNVIANIINTKNLRSGQWNWKWIKCCYSALWLPTFKW